MATRAAVPRSVGALKAACDACRDCPLGEPATQAVVGAGPRRARLMVVGEQPGDREDLAGQAFVGPAGRLLDAALQRAGIDRGAVFLTNAVKHFGFTWRGKRRLHETPGQREVDACLQWLQAEIAFVAPQAFVALGATAARALLGRPTPVLRNRGQWLARDDGRPVLVTVHPSALLRLRGDDFAQGLAAFVDDLGQAAGRA
ncbi:uracil-DNA glycosylase [Pseudorhodoferax aquiterrae]|uniref:Type-4 uracil-DNA glycosylase n=1 Tax=Pseudorhodoferax aquiterrae TaxID=747304 RepID=A0ABQ3G5P8_9BURK|nr:UdgX family uracil-DNA binding protein [Pseudorhodoferax aquiterrae]GHC91911.1 uracil-DNA glycosylase [Pseudorhodoferax aquiterrae]